MSPLKVGLVLIIAIGAFDDMAISTVLPLIVADLGGEQFYGAAFAAFVLASLFATIWAGRQCDVKGPRIPFLICILLFLVGFAMAALAPNMPIFVLARAVQGFGNGIAMAIVFAVINLAYNEQERPTALALVSAAWVVPSLIAPTGAGIIAELVHWRWIFPSLIPLLLITAWLTLPMLKVFDLSTSAKTTANTLWPAFRLSAGVALVLALISQEILPLPVIAIGVVFGMWICFGPFRLFMPPGIFSLGNGLATAMGLRFLLNFAFFGSEVLLPYMLINKYGYTAIEAGIVLTSAAVAWALGSQFQARYSQRLTPATFLLIGGSLLFFAVSGIASLVLLGVNIYWVYLFWSFAGFAVGTSFTCISAYAMAHTAKGDEGASASAAGVASSLGVGLATGIAGAILNFGNRNDASLETTLAVLWVMTLSACAIFLVVVAIRVIPQGRQPLVTTQW